MKYKLKSAYEAHLDYSNNENQLINLYLNLAYGATKMTWSYADNVHVEFNKEKGVYKSQVKATFHLSEQAYTNEELSEKGISERTDFIYIPLGEMPNWKTEEDIDFQYLSYIADKEIKRYFENEFSCSYFLEKLLPKEEKTYKEKLEKYNQIERLADYQKHDRRILKSPKNPIELWTFNEYTHQDLPF